MTKISSNQGSGLLANASLHAQQQAMLPEIRTQAMHSAKPGYPKTSDVK
jgi:hypothetical protein